MRYQELRLGIGDQLLGLERSCENVWVGDSEGKERGDQILGVEITRVYDV